MFDAPKTRNLLNSAVAHEVIIYMIGEDVFLATDPEARVRFPALPDFLGEKKEKETVMGLERGPLSLVSTTEELLDRKVAAPV
jgi:hypothetical protein